MTTQIQNTKGASQSSSIAVCLVVHNEEALVKRCLESVIPIADELIVVHDGPCTDNSLEIARALGATTFERPYRGVAEPHRVFAFEQVTSEWIFQIDADEFLDKETCAAIQSLVESKSVNGYIFRWEMWNEKRAISFPGLQKLCLFRRSKTSYLGISNEIARVTGTVERVDFYLRHRPQYNNISLRTRLRKIKKWAPIHAQYYFPHLSEYACFQTTADTWIASARRVTTHPLFHVVVQPLKHMLGGLKNGNVFGWYTWKSAFMMATYIGFVHWHVWRIARREQRAAVVFLHQYGAPHHVRALEALLREEKTMLLYKEFSFVRQIVRGVIRFRFQDVVRGFRNACSLLLLSLQKGRTIVLGAAPLDARIRLFMSIIRRHRIIYMTSWPYWSLKEGTFVYNTGASSVRSAWQSLIKSADQIVCVNQAGKQSLREHNWRSDEGSIQVIPHSVAQAVSAPQRGASPKGPLGVVFVGRLVEQKGIRSLIELAGQYSDIHVGIVGDGPLAQDVVRATKEHSNLTYHGLVAQDELANVLDQYDCIILPSVATEGWEELFGMALIEGMTRGLTPVATDCVGPHEIIKDAPYGHIVPQHDQTALHECISQLRKDVDQVRAHRDSIAAYAEKYSISHVQKAWETVIFSKKKA